MTLHRLFFLFLFFFNDTATTEIYTLSLHDALPIYLGPLARRHVHDRAVLHVGASADDDRVEVGAEHGVVPHGRVLLDRDVADEHRGRRDEGGRMHLGALSLEAEQWHGHDPRSMLGLLPILREAPGKGGSNGAPADHRRRDRDAAPPVRPSPAAGGRRLPPRPAPELFPSAGCRRAP